ncbi:MAG TPA: NAD(P)H-dependent oxidoreductase [Caulobacteraceae bacterium]|jgi:FMN reductase
MENPRPLIVGIGGTTGGPSSTETALRVALCVAEAVGARTLLFGGEALARLPHYNPKCSSRTEDEKALVDAVREAKGLIVASPGYHGSISGLVKNALDLLEDTANDRERPYLAEIPVGLIATAYGWQATGGTVAALRTIVHAFRGWPTPYAAAVNCRLSRFDPVTGRTDPEVMEQLAIVGRQVAASALRDGPAGQTTIPYAGLAAVA